MEDDENMEPKRSESPQKGLDELFRKTKTLPYVYWLPLSEQAAAARQRTREQAEREHQARLAANKPSPGRRSPHGYRNVCLLLFILVSNIYSQPQPGPSASHRWWRWWPTTFTVSFSRATSLATAKLFFSSFTFPISLAC